MNFSVPSQALTALKILNDSGYSAYIVGGAVRDYVMGKVPHDFDITTSATPEEIKKAFFDYRTIETGIKHGTVTVIIDSMPFEITTYRIDGGYTDKRRPDKVQFSDNLKDDLSRRDFTCNALAFNPDIGVVDEYGGTDDINNKVIRCVGEADKRFNEDALRIMRALRFASVLGFSIERNTAISIKKNYHLLKYVSAERLFSELLKLLSGDNVYDVLLTYSEVFFFIMPELYRMKDCEQLNKYHIYDVWEHTVKAVASIRNDPELRLAMLIHDSGKPSVKFRGEDGYDHFHGHPDVSAELAMQILNRFKASNQIKNHIVSLVKYHEFRPHLVSKNIYKKYIGILGIDLINELFEIRVADSLAQNPFYLKSSLDSIETGRCIVNNLVAEGSCFTLKDLKINGNDLMGLGFDSSPELGLILSGLLDDVIENKVKNERTALLNRAKELL